MKNAIYWLVLLIVVGAAGAGLYNEYQNTRPCAQPVLYSFGAVDARFDTSNATLLATAKAAGTIWNKEAGKTVLAYDPNANMKINLVYDEREASAKLGNQIALQQVKIDSIRATLEAAQADFDVKQTAYNEAVNEINARGGANKREAAALNVQRASLNALAEAINSQVAAFNADVAVLNAKVAEFNRTAGRTFREGEYIRDANGERINIYVFVGTAQLKRVLAHEFGHAIGLDHNGDSRSIMFAKNESGNLAPTAADLSALRALCGL